MGNQVGLPHTTEQVNTWLTLTYFTYHELVTLYQNYLCALPPEKQIARPADQSLTLAQFENMPEIKHSPFRSRIACTFSQNGSVYFEDYLDFRSVFSAKGTKELKSVYAFKIYGMKSFIRCI